MIARQDSYFHQVCASCVCLHRHKVAYVAKQTVNFVFSEVFPVHFRAHMTYTEQTA